ncbi:protein DPCD-like [Watersipora subatra]|uniref:protein DPCD-like n=1 Tax=Watersipora subatra TaxID=2589382 RepID=UPI00355BC320
MTSAWLKSLESAQKTALLQDGRRKVHYTFTDGRELVEEYDVKSNELILRKLREKGTLGNTKDWVVEVGEARDIGKMVEVGLSESVSNPAVARKDNLESFQWRIRNLTYPIDTYLLSIEDNKIVVRTSNKKYFKRLEIPDMSRLDISLNPSALTYAHANNTLIITYKKPVEVLDFERKLINKLKSLKSEGDVDHCKQQ